MMVMRNNRLTVNTVFISNIPVDVEESTLKKQFETVGHIIHFRMFAPKQGKDFKSCIVEYMDDKTAETAISRLNGFLIGERALRVTVANNNSLRKRNREGNKTEDGRLLVDFPRSYMDPLLRTDGSPVLAALRTVPVEDAYEAVEQFRSLCLARRQDGIHLLEEFPALKGVIVMLLQHAGKLHQGPLPAEAYMSTPSEATGATPNEKKAGPSSRKETDEVLEMIKSLSDEEINKISSLTDEDLEKMTNKPQQQQMRMLRDRLVEMISNLE
ncbi:RNA recognition motif. (a.k.a. RRM, RBD, or RNP domain), putative [Angomonas deanei]|uniref:RNA recognition motif. (A.k.a. RRM, RBD, or RNP domain), putative n=1 Tax=Angomonas deanei TaxID=59799 RepID=A0A7G2C9S1_9TRYP|nr:RNA recognition motif. (a.k.a. RRM, RBD, or RNP domain), putative [Angomonas deanei]